jgi:hypothetical protein
MLVADQVVGTAVVPLNVTVLVPFVAPKLAPVMVITVPTGPLLGVKDVTVGGTVTVNGKPVLFNPLTVTTMLPVVAPFGTGTTMLAVDHDVGVADTPLNVTALVPFVAPKFAPAIVTDVPTGPLAGVTLVTVGATVTVNVDALLATPPTVTTTPPVVEAGGTGTTMLVADQLVGTAVTPLNVTVLVPFVAPKPLPVIVVTVPTGPDEGPTVVIVGPDDGVNGISAEYGLIKPAVL